MPKFSHTTKPFSKVFWLIIGFASAAAFSVMAATTISTNIATEGNLTVSGSGSIGTGLANHLDISGGTTGNPVTISAAGSDTDIPIQVQAKNAGFIILGPPENALNPVLQSYVGDESVLVTNTSHFAGLAVQSSPPSTDGIVGIYAVTLGHGGATKSTIGIESDTSVDADSATAIGFIAGAVSSGVGPTGQTLHSVEAYVNANSTNSTIIPTGVNFYGYAPSRNGNVTSSFTNFYGFWQSDLASDAPVTNAYYSWFDSRGVRRVKEDNTFNGVGQAIEALYNPQFTKYTPGATDYERVVLGQWSSNTVQIGTEAGGTGTLRDLQLIGRNIGIGTSSPASLLSLSSTATTTVQLGATGAGKGSCVQMYSPNHSAFRLYVANNGTLTTQPGSCH